MAVHVKYYFGTPGANSITDPELAYVTILRVARDGVVHREWEYDALYTGTAEFKYGPPTGYIEFNPDVPFQGSPTGRPNRHFMTKIAVKYEV